MKGRYTVIMLIWAALIMCLLTISLGDSLSTKHSVVPYQDKIAHFFMFAVLYVLAAKAVQEVNWNVSKWSILLGVCLYSIVTELVQVFLEDRFFEILDIIANIMGALGAFLFYNRK